MQKVILAFNFTVERLQALRPLCLLLKARLRPVERQELLQPVGYLAGIKGIAPTAELYAGEEAKAELLLFCGLTRAELDRLLAAIRKSSLRQVALKAVLTPTNCSWNGLELQQELAQEHEYLHGNAQNK